VLFQAPVEAGRPARRRTRKAAASADAEPAAESAPEKTDEAAEQPRARRTRQRRTQGTDQDQQAEATTAAPAAEAKARQQIPEQAPEQAPQQAEGSGEQDDEQAEGEGPRRRRRRRGGRRRRKSGDSGEAGDESAESDDESEDESGADDQTGQADQAEESDEASGDADESGEGTASRRRRRRRRRKGEDGASAADDPDEVVVRVREPRKTAASEITAVEGSTRLEAKKQRRREGRAAGRRRAPIVTEAEFLARRESVERTMVIRARETMTQIAVSEDNVLVEHYVAQEEQSSLIGNVYLGRVQNVLPSMEAAFIDIGKGRNAVLYAGEVDWATLGGANGPRKIEQVLKSGQAVLVQVTKDPVGHKGARLTNQISLPGRYVVYVPRGGNGGISRKLPDTERNRLKGILKEIVPDEAGVIVRTAAEGASEDELTRDVSRLKSYWDDIEKKAAGGQAPQLVYGEPDLLIRVVRDLFTEDFSKLVIQSDDAFDLVNDYVSYVAPHLADRVEKWSGDGDVFANFRIDEQIKKALDRKVWLPSGGSLIIDRTEAMTVVDVNTGKFTGSGGNLEETVTRNNLEAAEEIVRQLRLRDVGGIIVVDFIDMVLESNRDLVLRRLVECLGRDRTKHQVAEVTSLGLVQMTRKRIGTGLLEAFSEVCDHCGGRGLILHDEPREPKRRTEESQGRGRDSKSGGKSSSRGGRGRGRKQAAEADGQPEASANGHNGQDKKHDEDMAATPV
jgi:ribonuclease E